MLSARTSAVTARDQPKSTESSGMGNAPNRDTQLALAGQPETRGLRYRAYITATPGDAVVNRQIDKC